MSRSKGYKGLFITFEGGEGAGKTSLIDQLETDLKSRGYQTIRLREPGGTWLGEKVRTILLDATHKIAPYAELALFLASRAQHLFDVILPAIEEGKIVLCDRFNDSTIAYQGVARGLGIQPVSQACHLFCQGVRPDLTLYLDLDPVIGLERASKERSKDRIEQEEIAFHQRIRSAYQELAKKEPNRIHTIDASQPREKVFHLAKKEIETCLMRSSGTPL